MPATRKSTRAAPGPRKQSTLSFNHRVTKSVPKSAKETSLSAAFASKEPVKEKGQGPASPDDDQVQRDEEARPLLQTAEAAPDLSEARARAETINDRAIEKYWRQVEAQRRTARVHKEPLTTGEKLLCYFDVSSQYGPCIGITRQKRWRRAERLGLAPPIEVLAVLLKEEAEGNPGVQKAHLDELMGATAMGSI